MEYIIRGLMVGIVIGIPLGQAAEMLVQNASKYGIKSGMAAGFGASLAYLFFATVDSLLVSFFSKYILKAEPALGYIVGGIFFVIGLAGILKKENDYDTDNSNSSNFMNAMNGFMLGMTNKFAIVAIIYLEIFFGVRQMAFKQGVTLTLFTALGAFLWWFVIAFFAGISGKKRKIKNILLYNILSNIFVILAGMAIIVSKII